MAITFGAAVKYFTENRLSSNRARNTGDLTFAQLAPLQYTASTAIGSTATETATLVLDSRTAMITVQVQVSSATTTPNICRVSLNNTVEAVASTTGMIIPLFELPLDAAEAATDTVVGTATFYVQPGVTIGVGLFNGAGSPAGNVRVIEYATRAVQVTTLVP